MYEQQYHKLMNKSLIPKQKYKKIKDIECRICFELINEGEKIVKPCSCVEGIYHKRCIIDWVLKKMRDGNDDYNMCEVCNDELEGLNIERKSNIKSHYISFGVTGIIYSIITFVIVKWGLKYFKDDIPIFIYIFYILFSVFILIIIYVSILSCIEKRNYFINNKSICPITYNVITISESIN